MYDLMNNLIIKRSLWIFVSDLWNGLKGDKKI